MNPDREPQKEQDRIVGRFHPGASTARRVNVSYRLGKLQKLGILHGLWLDCGCAEGGYASAMIERGAAHITGIDMDWERVRQAHRRSLLMPAEFCCAMSESLPFASEIFDGVFLNEVLEHVVDEMQTLREIYRVLKNAGILALISPNRWFPFEGHGMRIIGREIHFPIPFLSWVPKFISRQHLIARNYWPGELSSLVQKAGFVLCALDTVFPVLEFYPWLPSFIIRHGIGA